MSESHIDVNVSCGKCGSVLETADDNPTDDSIVTCKACGQEIGSYRNVVAEARRLAMNQAKEVVSAEFKKLKRAFDRTITIKL